MTGNVAVLLQEYMNNPPADTVEPKRTTFGEEQQSEENITIN